jgi:hypothetical protein
MQTWDEELGKDPMNIPYWTQNNLGLTDLCGKLAGTTMYLVHPRFRLSGGGTEALSSPVPGLL